MDMVRPSINFWGSDLSNLPRFERSGKDGPMRPSTLARGMHLLVVLPLLLWAAAPFADAAGKRRPKHPFLEPPLAADSGKGDPAAWEEVPAGLLAAAAAPREARERSP